MFKFNAHKVLFKSPEIPLSGHGLNIDLTMLVFGVAASTDGTQNESSLAVTLYWAGRRICSLPLAPPPPKEEDK